MNSFFLKNSFIKNINISLCDKYFLKNKKLKLSFEDRVAVQNNFIFEYRSEGVHLDTTRPTPTW